MTAYVHDIANVIKEGQKAGTFVDIPPTTQALLILGMCNGATDWYGTAPSPRGIEEIADNAARIALAGAQGAVRKRR
jgi:hypothetical protein